MNTENQAQVVAENNSKQRMDGRKTNRKNGKFLLTKLKKKTKINLHNMFDRYLLT